jgi:large subunit ribosomal protein LP0
MSEIKEMTARKKRKHLYWNKLEKAFNTYKNILVISVDFVGSRQMQDVRLATRGKAEIIMGKNTIMRKVIRDNSEKNPKLAALLPLIKGNMGFIFTNSDLNKIRKQVVDFKMPAAAKAGVLAPSDVVIPAGPTGLDPGQTGFFQTLNVATKIVKGTIEITSDVRLCFKGEKVTSSAVALLSKLNIRPFEYGINVNDIYEDGDVYSAAVLDLNQDDLVVKFGGAIARLAAVSYEIGEINAATLPQSFGKAFNTLVAIAIGTDYEFAELAAVKAAMAAGPATGGAGGAAKAGGAAAAAAEPEEEEEEAPAMDMFGGEEEDAAAGDY